jgi:lysophospholipase L1-like esterase
MPNTNQPQSRGGCRRVLFAVAAAALAAIVGFAAVELMCRALGLAPPLVRQYDRYVPDPWLPYRLKPLVHETGPSESGEFECDYRHNSLGFRDVEHAEVAPPGTFRILGLGDSFTYGVGAPFEQTYLYRLEAMLDDRPGEHPRVAVIKTGIPRFYPELQRILLDRYGRPFRPDLVVAGFLPNDVLDTHLGIDAVRVDPGGFLKTQQAAELGALGTWAYQRSHVARLVLRRYVRWQIGRKFHPDFPAVYRANGAHEPEWRQIEREYERIAAICAELGARFVILHIPQMGPWTEESRYPAQRLAAWAASRGVGFVDALPALQQATGGGEPLYFPKDTHCTPAGYAVIAEVLYGYLTREGFVP